MKKNIALLALTGILTLASCSQVNTTPNGGSDTGSNPGGDTGSNPGGDTSNPGGGDTSNPTNAGSIQITSPKANAAVKPGSVEVAFTAKDVKDIKCSVDGHGKSVTAANGACTVSIPKGAGTYTIEVSGVGSKDGKNVTASVNVTVKAVAQPNVKPGFINKQEILESADAGTDYERPELAEGAWRMLPHQVNEVKVPNIAYVRGDVGVVAVSDTADRVQIWVSDTSKSNSGKYVYDGKPQAADKVVFTFESRDYNGKQGEVMYLVSRTTTNGKSVTESFPFIVDNSGPDAPKVEINAATSKDRYIKQLRGVQDLNWARGSVSNRLSNNIVDEPKSGKMPAGLDRVTYYYVPAAKNAAIPNWKQSNRIAKIKANAAHKRVAEYAGNKNQYDVVYDSVAAADVEGATYYVYVVATDQLGNESDGQVFSKVSFDNHAPTVAAGIRDVSPLPFASTDSTKYISDWFRFDYAQAEDKGVGFNPKDNNVVSLDNISVDLVGTKNANSLIPVVAVKDLMKKYDSNLVGDGAQKLNARVSDLLGNTVDKQMGDFLIDNVDPAVSFKSPESSATLVAGKSYSVSTRVDESGSGLDKDRTALLWNDYVNDKRTRANGYMGAPVQFASGTAGSWNALAASSGNNKAVSLVGLAVDKAGNASMVRRTVNVTSDVNVTAANQPKLGKWDVYQYGNLSSRNLRLPTQGKLHVFKGGDKKVDLLGKVGKFDAQMVEADTGSRAGGLVSSVTYNRELLWESWKSVVNYVTGKNPDGSKASVSYKTHDLDPTLKRQGMSVATDRSLNWVDITDKKTAPVFNGWGGSKSSDYHEVKGAQFGHHEHGSEAVHAIVTDDKGMYSVVEEVEKAYSVRNMTSAGGAKSGHWDYTIATRDTLVASVGANAKTYALQTSQDGVNFSDVNAGYDLNSIKPGTTEVRASYTPSGSDKYLRLRVSKTANDHYFSDVVDLSK